MARYIVTFFHTCYYIYYYRPYIDRVVVVDFILARAWNIVQKIKKTEETAVQGAMATDRRTGERRTGERRT